MILAGGKGERMNILCLLTPKPALPFAGRLRVIDFSLSNCVRSGFDNITVLVDYQRSYMVDYLREWQLWNVASASLHILDPGNHSYNGTADAVYQNLDHVQQSQAERVLILAGDHVYNLDYRYILDFHDEMKADVTVGVMPVPAGETYRFGTVTIDSDGQVVNFWEKSRASPSTLASMGIYVFNKSALIKGLSEDAADQNSRHDFGYSILPQMVKKARVFAYRFSGYWKDIGTVDGYYEANMEALNETPPFSLDVMSAIKMPLFTWRWSGRAPRIIGEAMVTNSLISSDCVIKGTVENSIVGPKVFVGDRAVVSNSIVMGGCRIGYHSIIDRCILDEFVNIGQMCYLGYGPSLIPAKYDVTIVGKKAVVPSHTAIGRNCKIMPYVCAEDFPASAISHDSVISTVADRRVFAVK